MLTDYPKQVSQPPILYKNRQKNTKDQKTKSSDLQYIILCDIDTLKLLLIGPKNMHWEMLLVAISWQLSMKPQM